MFAIGAAIVLAVAMTAGDMLWAGLSLRHRVGYGLAHGALMCLLIGGFVGWHARRPLAGVAAGPAIGVLAAGLFYLLAPWLRYSAMFPAWIFFWICFALLQKQLAREPAWAVAIMRGLVAAIVSGLAFYMISACGPVRRAAARIISTTSARGSWRSCRASWRCSRRFQVSVPCPADCDVQAPENAFACISCAHMRAYPRVVSALFTTTCLLGTTAVAQEVTKETVAGIRNLARLETTVACAGAITADAVPEIKKMGFASIVNLRLAANSSAMTQAHRSRTHHRAWPTG